MSLKAVVLNCSLKGNGETSNTRALIDEVVKVFDKKKVETKIFRLADHNIPAAISTDVGEGDEWPEIFEAIKAADILIIGTPIWLGEKSSIATKAIERLYGGSSLTNDKGQAIYYNKVGGAVVTGNEDGGKNASRSIIYSLSHIGFTIPPNVDAYWVGEAGPGPSFIEAEGYKNDFTINSAKTLGYNLVHFAEMLKAHPIPVEGNTLSS
ncbi:Multimeric flavodoxin WrbA [Alkalibacterium putridalgicola]|uniref:8-demethyl-8-aminoriboflavin-5'-phosphate (AFP) synthase RosB n=1 Tax=Alkalibacterium putridalgicola TaxID=426703 RepID=A0A1H7UL33_9LACT|nr:flavodoxin family protein [Alkalibacterium putridalgicola]GEK88250.1 8-demethyl-8-aminoriboflavin-5'-phosphate (AFP) synthase RosB [Alkalibacterium putridalgicola]SEL97509.1 Multimeric flavodoxin WrbA [Alkalibacterium putridalgicola]